MIMKAVCEKSAIERKNSKSGLQIAANKTVSPFVNSINPAGFQIVVILGRPPSWCGHLSGQWKLEPLKIASYD